MYDRETVELALLALEEGMTQAEAAELCGATRGAVEKRAAGMIPHERKAGTIVYRETVREVPAANAEERAAYEAAMTENQLLRAVLDDLKAGGCAPAPNVLWVTDITEFRLPCGSKAYLSAVVDCFDGRPAGWSTGPSPTARLADSSLEAACAPLAPGERPVVHSDRGGHYRWPGWVEACRRYRLVRSMSRKGASPDNARMEGFFGLLKSEFFHSRDWEGWDAWDFMAELNRWLHWFRSGRISEALGWRTPDENRRLLGYAV